MIQHRRVLVPVFLAGFAAFLFLIPAGPVQARTTSNAALTKRFFNERSLPQDVPLPEGKGKEITQQKCNMCHASTVWVKKHYTQDQWTAVMDQMVDKGMVATDDEIATMTTYLTANFGPRKEAPVPPPPPQ